jgi:hypothetical protein
VGFLKAICKMISRIVILISKSVFLSSRINILVSKNLNEIKTKFLKGNFTPKCDFFLIRLDFPFPKNKKDFLL